MKTFFYGALLLSHNVLKFEIGACFFISITPIFIFSPQKQDRIVALSSALVPKKCNFIAPPALIMQFLIAQFFPFLPPTMLYVEYITLHIGIYSKLQSYKFRLSAMRQYRSKIIYRPTLLCIPRDKRKLNYLYI